MRVVHVINGLTTGGAETVLYRLATYRSNVEHEVICLERQATYSAKLEAHGIKVHHLDWTGAASSPVSWVRLRRLLRESGADVVQAWMYRSNILAGFAAKSVGLPIVWNIRCSSVALLRPATRFLARLGGVLARSVPARIINCSAASAELHAKLGYDPREVVVIPNGYDPRLFYPDERARAATRLELGADASTFLIGSFGRWEPEKGYSVLFRALALLRERGLQFRTLLIGPNLDASNGALRNLIAQFGCTDFVQAIGERSDVPAIARSLDLHVLASLTEGFPNVVAETMLSGTPNVATDVGDSSLIVGKTGWLVRADDPHQLADAIEQAHAEWVRSSEAWRDRQVAARQRIVDNFSLEAMVEGYEEVWEQVAGPSARELQGQFRSQQGPTPKNLRVLHIINSLTLGGAEALLYRIAVRDKEDEHVVVSLAPRAWYSSRLEESGIRVHHLDINSTVAVPRAMLRLRKLIGESGADVVHCWMYRSNVIGGFIARQAGKPVIWGIHSASLDALRPSSRAVVRLSGLMAHRTPDFIINCSTRSAQLHESIGYSAAPGAVIRNGYDSAVWFPDETSRSEIRKALAIEDGEFAVGAVTRWDPLKDIPNLLGALRIARDRGAVFRCLLVGAGLGSNNSQLTELVRRHGCEELVVLLGARSDVQAVARAVDLHVLASRTESFPNVVAETMLSETPNVVTDVGDAAVMVGETGWVVPPANSEALADAIIEAYREWTTTPEKWSTRRRSARERVMTNFSFDRMMKAYRAVWREVARRDHQGFLKPTAVQ